MNLPDQFVLSDLLKHRVQCDRGIDHGHGLSAWMHPPVHRLLGWVTKPSSLKVSREVWKLNQLRGIGKQYLYVKGQPSLSDVATLDRLPTLLDADLINKDGDSIGVIADLVFQPRTGLILYYLVSRTDPRIPGTSRWRLTIDRIRDQQPGMISTDLHSIDDLPLIKSSIRQDILRTSRNLREQLHDFSNQATVRLEGWLEDPPWDTSEKIYKKKSNFNQNDILNNWEIDADDEYLDNDLEYLNESKYKNNSSYDKEDPWI